MTAMDDKTLVERCSICGCQLDAPADPTSRNCGGDCLSCMALVAEDPACMGAYIEFQTTRIEALEAEIRRYMGVHGVLTQDDRDRLKQALEGKSND